MCELFNRIVYGIPVPALTFLMATKVLNESRYSREALMGIRRARLPREIIQLIDKAMVEGKASILRTEWWSSLKLLLPNSFDDSLHTEESKGPAQEVWLEMLSRDMLWEITDSNRCCLNPRKLQHDEEHELVRHLREYLSTLPRPLVIANRTPLSKSSMVIHEKAQSDKQAAKGEEEEEILVICLPDHVLQYGNRSPFPDKQVIGQMDLDDCDVDTLQIPRGMVEKVDVENGWNEDFVFSMRLEFQQLLKECDLALGTGDGNGLIDNLDRQLGWWRVEEVVCDCQDDENAPTL
ncbi:hypothetical protein MJO28_015756 [Puccinia striiformis f. sp. tritici]|uniref:Uncharacterized protein n=4 Tax=Puccinia striiformis TaxID=27350 RepID=A0A0L0UTU3_9BASI|nr:hypothetical protein Pst134EA_029271 [Puccinia striiformis f. sp. tritici]KAI9614223.1 hypothetical protein H4Q26_009364 [Puccinia striiformis f. sp. tritici PST-130]KNE90356.1 hypothetical protein PSTG_16179 [Puccinia striiformis f. sp. tritici PST-78]POW16627.1 hypothetical protein PSTT_01095 [Puccinia striiformis]KAH9441265.1 hypothetical protein Pst134EB_029929 [Puccinia striiformis f. sp. tritici]KAH9447238.1 hypothetical protein Pst134EA_029271 [Puccinia striiformis f. sp. tritici]